MIMFIVSIHATGGHSKQLRPCSFMNQNYLFPFEIVIVGKMDCYQNFIYLSFLSRKNKSIKASKMPIFSKPPKQDFLFLANQSCIEHNVSKHENNVQERLQKSRFWKFLPRC